MKSGIANLVVLNWPGHIEFYVVAQKHRTKSTSITVKPWVKIIFDFRLKRSTDHYIITYRGVGRERRLTRPTCSDIIKSRKLHVPEEIRINRPICQSTYQRHTQF